MQVTIDRPDLAGLMNSVCKITTNTRDKAYGGHGVFLLPDIVLTSFHVVTGGERLTFTGPDGRTAEMVRGSPYAKKWGDRDLATIELSRPLTSDVAVHTDSDLYIHRMKGYLASSFTGAAKCHHVGFNPVVVRKESQNMHMQDYLCDEKIVKGYSGSPVFDARGKLVSLACAISKDRWTGNTMEHLPSPEYPNGLFRFEGPRPADTARFVRWALDI